MNQDAWSNEIRSCREQAVKWLRDQTDNREVVACVLEFLERLNRLHEETIPSIYRFRHQYKRNRVTDVRFRIDNRRRGSFLVKCCSTGVMGRCPETTYMVLSRVLNGVEQPLQVDQIADLIRKQTNHWPSDGSLRVCLSFWQSISPCLIVKQRARYLPVKLFAEQAQRAWVDLRERNVAEIASIIATASATSLLKG